MKRDDACSCPIPELDCATDSEGEGNLGAISYIDSGRLGTLVEVNTTVRYGGASIKLANLTRRVGDLLQVTKLLTVFGAYDSEEKAIQAFRKAAVA